MPVNISNEEKIANQKENSELYIKGNQLYFKGLLILKLEERKRIVLEMHHEIGHFGQHWTFAEVYKIFYWHNQTK